MDNYIVFPDAGLSEAGPVSHRFLEMGIAGFHEACRYVHQLPYGYNSDRDDPLILFKEGFGSCTTKHAVIASLAAELGLEIEKHIGIYAMTEEIVAGAGRITEKYDLPCVPMLHCFLACGHHRVDLTEGNRNGKKKPVDEFLYTSRVEPNISARDEYLLYRKALKERLLTGAVFEGADLRRILKAREKGLALLHDNIK